MYLVCYLFVGTTYSSAFNGFFIWSLHASRFHSALTYLKLMFPLATLLIDTSAEQYQLVICLINFIGSLFLGFLLFYHARNAINGSVTHEKTKLYKLGRMENIRLVFGERWYLTWLSPFVESALPHDGVRWQSVTKTH